MWSLDRKRGSNDDLHQPQDTTLEVCFARVDAKRARKPTCLEGPRPGGPTGAPTPAWSRLLRVGASAVRAVDGIVDVRSILDLTLNAMSNCCLDLSLRHLGSEAFIMYTPGVCTPASLLLELTIPIHT